MDGIIEFPEAPVRKRGRPRGKPKPLNEKEKRNRNATYERERRALTTGYLEILIETLRLRHKTKTEEVIVEAKRVLDNLKDEEERLADEKTELEHVNAMLQDKLRQLLSGEGEGENLDDTDSSETSDSSSDTENNPEEIPDCEESSRDTGHLISPESPDSQAFTSSNTYSSFTMKYENPESLGTSFKTTFTSVPSTIFDEEDNFNILSCSVPFESEENVKTEDLKTSFLNRSLSVSPTINTRDHKNIISPTVPEQIFPSDSEDEDPGNQPECLVELAESLEQNIDPLVITSHDFDFDIQDFATLLNEFQDGESLGVPLSNGSFAEDGDHQSSSSRYEEVYTKKSQLSFS